VPVKSHLCGHDRDCMRICSRNHGQGSWLQLWPVTNAVGLELSVSVIVAVSRPGAESRMSWYQRQAQCWVEVLGYHWDLKLRASEANPAVECAENHSIDC